MKEYPNQFVFLGRVAWTCRTCLLNFGVFDNEPPERCIYCDETEPKKFMRRGYTSFVLASGLVKDNPQYLEIKTFRVLYPEEVLFYSCANTALIRSSVY